MSAGLVIEIPEVTVWLTTTSSVTACEIFGTIDTNPKTTTTVLIEMMERLVRKFISISTVLFLLALENLSLSIRYIVLESKVLGWKLSTGKFT